MNAAARHNPDCEGWPTTHLETHLPVITALNWSRSLAKNSAHDHGRDALFQVVASCRGKGTLRRSSNLLRAPERALKLRSLKIITQSHHTAFCRISERRDVVLRSSPKPAHPVASSYQKMVPLRRPVSKKQAPTEGNGRRSRSVQLGLFL